MAPVGSSAAVKPGLKVSVLNARVTSETRQALEAEAKRSGRSLSATVELWLELSRRLDAGPLTDTIATMLRYAAVVERLEGPPDQSLIARDLLREGWSILARSAAPFVTDNTATGKAALDAISALRNQAIRTIGVIASEGEAASPVVSALLARLANARLHPVSVDWRPALETIEQAAEKAEKPLVASSLKVTLNAMRKAETKGALQVAAMGDVRARAADLLLYLGDAEATISPGGER